MDTIAATGTSRGTSTVRLWFGDDDLSAVFSVMATKSWSMDVISPQIEPEPTSTRTRPEMCAVGADHEMTSATLSTTAPQTAIAVEFNSAGTMPMATAENATNASTRKKMTPLRRAGDIPVTRSDPPRTTARANTALVAPSQRVERRGGES